MKRRLKLWISGILCASMIMISFPVYASPSTDTELVDVLENAETVDETTEEIETAELPDMTDGEDIESSYATEIVVGGGSVSLKDDDSYETISEIEIYGGDYRTIDVLIDGEYVDDNSYTCVSSNENIVQISNYYSDRFVLKGIAPGNAQITVSTEDGNECTLNVTVKATEITFYRSYDDNVQDLIIGTDYDSTAFIEIYRNGTDQYAGDYTCTSSNENIAKVYYGELGYDLTIEGISSGTATITVTNEYGESGVLNVTVKESDSSGYLYKDSKGNILRYGIYGHQITITGYKTAKGAITIPSQIDGMDVVAVGSWAFYSCTSISKLIVENGVKEIQYDAFGGCSGLASVELPDSIESIGSWAFSGCRGLTSFRIPPKVTSIDEYTFIYCSLSSVTIPDGVTYIGNSAFSDCKLSSVNLPESLEEMGGYAFSYNPLKTITIPKNVVSIDKEAFETIDTLESIKVDSNNKAYSSKDGILFNKAQTELLRYPVARTNLYYEIPTTVTGVGAYAFNGAKNLMSVTIPESVSFIDSNAFRSEKLNYLYLLGKNAPTTTADAIIKDYYGNSDIIIAVPQGATGYTGKPWSDFTVKKQGTVRPTSAAFGGTEFTIPPYTDEPCLTVTVSPANAVCKDVIYKIGDKEVYSFKAGTFCVGDQGTHTLTAITKDGHAKATVKLIVKQNSKYFTDMWNSTHPFYKPIYWAAEHGVTNGYSDGTFGVNRNCTRGEFVMFLWKMMGKPAVKSISRSPFKDVSQSHAFYKAILWASQNGITKGYSDGTFGINKNCTRGEIMMFLWRAKGKPAPKAVSNSPFKDVAKTHTFYNAILWGSQNGITKGYSDGTFGINRNCTRGEIVTFLYRIR